MLNQVVVVGRIVSFLEAPEYGDGAVIITVRSPQSDKNSDGVYEDNIFDIIVKSDKMVSNCTEYLKPGDLAGFKAKLETYKFVKNNKKYRRTIIIANAVSFLSSSTPSEPTISEEESSES